MPQKLTAAGGSSSVIAEVGLGGSAAEIRIPEGRRPKETQRPKPELRSAAQPRIELFSDFGLRSSFGSRVSAFGFPLCGLPRQSPQPASRSRFEIGRAHV